ncbi:MULTISPECIES: hypothetical protein [unclassified Methylophaga]|jgi:uncharacterized protein YdeI (BOF family)|uniref:hypothetical protein n=1 Tax=unclassified Methylophaga TaxID=2629249 RepID=UPI000C4FDAD7|nr:MULTISPECIES: hypothetical protein [unclassified Methylophaga]MAL50600.1 hypothetical protein [Methylophaga sp.]MAP26747.1 hypothetical protein [Methylophaga sp.]MBP25786.1 hypothetical protein [Methylophaga sp.]HAD31806.1 hypothetical protein [Methylophaga sp.]HBX61324.1 hypothetical protein [Methylophaga sp.]|tara:strand:- start:2482 stop:3093 length:612 start_codon:yes stop_codon:yes gene_type:complete
MKNSHITTLAVFALLSASAVAENPYAKENNSWISINGEVDSVSTDQFELDYGEGNITVVMEDDDRKGYQLKKGDEVRVSGLMDDNFYNDSVIEAGSVHIKNANTYFYAGAMDEQDVDFTVMSPILRDTVIKGNITHVSLKDEEFTLDTGIQMLTVEVDEMLSNPLDNEGYLQLSVGDRVSVNGKIDNDLFEGRVFEAVSVTKI